MRNHDFWRRAAALLWVLGATGAAVAAPPQGGSPWTPAWLTEEALASGLAPEQPYLEDGDEIAVQGIGVEAFFAAGGIVEAPPGKRLFGLAMLVDGEGVEALAFRAYDARGRLIASGPVEITWSEGIAHVGDIRLNRPAARIVLDAGDAAIRYVRLEPITAPRAPRRVLARELPVEKEAAAKNVVPSYVVTRAQWGARATGTCGSSHSPRYLTVHHTATPNNDSLTPAARMRQMQAYHIDTLGWCDLGYHFVVGIDGKVYEGRPHARTGAHVGNWNTNNVGVSVVGTFVGFQPRQSQLDALTDIARWLVDRYGIAKNRSAILGHKEWPGHESNSCPGLILNYLPTLVQRLNQSNPPPPPPPPPQTTILESFEQGVGRFTRAPTWSGSTRGISAQSFAQRSNLQAKNGQWSLQVMLRDDPNSGADWFVRLLSGDGNPASNVRLAKAGGRIGAWFYTGASAIQVRFLVDDSDGTEISNPVTLPQNQWFYYEVRLDDSAQWNAWAGGNGIITASEVTLDAIVFERAQTSWDVYIYVDDVQYRRQ